MFKKPPLPFIGNKNKYIKYINVILIPYLKHNGLIDDKTIIVDVFGGSGILSHIFAFNFPNNQIIYNDYDNYTQYLKHDNLIKLNKILHYLRNIFDNYPTEKITAEENEKEHIFDKIKSHINKFFPNWSNTYIRHWLNNQLLFNALDKPDDENNILYNRVKKNDYETDIYNNYILPNIQITHNNYQTVFKTYGKNNNCIFILDPPYNETFDEAYKSAFTLNDTLTVLNFAIHHKSIYFESSKFKIMKYIKEYKQTVKFTYNLLQKSKFQLNSPNTDYMIMFNL